MMSKILAYIFLVFVTAQGITADDCTKSWDGLTVTCESTFSGQRESVTIKLETCREKPQITFSIIVAALGIDWTETFDESKDVAIPGFSLAGNGIYLGVEIYSNTDGTTHLKMTLSVKTIFGKLSSTTLLDDTIAKSTCNGFLYWWNSQIVGIKAAVGGGGALFLIILIACCCKCCCSKKSERQQTTIVMTPPTHPAPNTIITNTTQQQQMQYAPMPNMGSDPYGVPYKKL